MVPSVQTVHLSCVKIGTISKRTKQGSTRPSSLALPLGASKMIYEPMVRLTQIEHLSWIDANTVSKQIETRPQDPRQLGVPSGASNTISEPTVRLTQTMHQSCIKSSTISERTEPSFHLSLVTKEFHHLRSKRFLCLWYVHWKPCTCLALKLTLSPNRLKRDST
jgi:hypothetical protein